MSILAAFSNVRVERDARCTVDIPTLELAPGRITAVLGTNGAGKTTLLRLLAGLELPSTGSIHAPHRREIAFAFQHAAFFRMSLRKNLELPLELVGIEPAKRRARAEWWAGALGVGALLDRDPASLSGGERQRASVARALAVEAPLTLLDEPLGLIDERARLGLLEALPPLLRRRGATCVIVTHRLEEALALSDDLVVLDAGRVRAVGTTADVLAAPPTGEAALLLGYLVVESGDGILAIPPSAVVVGETAAHVFPAVVVQVAEWSGHCEALIRPRQGSGVRRMSWPPGVEVPAAGSEIRVSSSLALRLRR